MGIKVIGITEFIDLLNTGSIPVFDARSESEFSHAHVPGALSLPLLNDDERIEVGTVYKHKGKSEAVLTGFRLVGPRFHEIISQAIRHAPQKKVILYCWRGGMRSQIISWMLQMSGFEVFLLEGGYKTFRNWALEIVSTPVNALILGGPTGSGKTELLQSIRDCGQQVLELEGLANHRGSAFGALGKGTQPSNEYFENLIALEWAHFDISKPVWIENESRTIGSCLLPESVYEVIRNSPLVEITVGDKRRKKRILDEYGVFPIEVLAATTKKIGKRLGPQHLAQALKLLDVNDLDGWLEIVLGYYDNLYAYGRTQRDQSKCYDIDLEDTEEINFPKILMEFSKEHFNFITNGKIV